MISKMKKRMSMSKLIIKSVILVLTVMVTSRMHAYTYKLINNSPKDLKVGFLEFSKLKPGAAIRRVESIKAHSQKTVDHTLTDEEVTNIKKRFNIDIPTDPKQKYLLYNWCLSKVDLLGLIPRVPIGRLRGDYPLGTLGATKSLQGRKVQKIGELCMDNLIITIDVVDEEKGLYNIDISPEKILYM